MGSQIHINVEHFSYANHVLQAGIFFDRYHLQNFQIHSMTKQDQIQNTKV